MRRDHSVFSKRFIVHMDVHLFHRSNCPLYQAIIEFPGVIILRNAAGTEKYPFAARVVSQQLWLDEKFPVHRNAGVLPRSTGGPKVKYTLTSPPVKNSCRYLHTSCHLRAVVLKDSLLSLVQRSMCLRHLPPMLSCQRSHISGRWAVTGRIGDESVATGGVEISLETV
jgi:hypothetical protein